VADPGDVMLGGHRRLLLPVSAGIVVAVVAVMALAGLRADTPAPDTVALSAEDGPAAVARAFLDAWEDEDWDGLQAHTEKAEVDAAAVHAEAHRVLRVTATSTRMGTPVVADGRASVPAQVSWDLGVLGEVSHDVELPLVRRADGTWRVRWWYPVVHPDLTPQRRFQRVRAFQDRAPLHDHTGAPLVESAPQTAVLLDPARAEEALDGLAALLEADPGALRAAVDGADRPVEVARLPLDRGEELREDLLALPGVDVERTSARQAATPALAGLLGTVGEVTAERLEELGEPYRPGDRVGRSGLERAHERRLAGEPQLEARIVEGSQLVTTLAFVDGAAPEPVEVTLDAAVQEAALAALEGVDLPAAVVALDTGTGAVRAAVSTPEGELRRALEGRYAPGSTAKIVTAAAALAAGVEVDAPVDCPPSRRYGERELRNAGGDGPGTIGLVEAMARSCNTAFAGLAEDVGAEALLAMAETFGFGVDYDLGLPAFGGVLPEPAGRHELALAAIGQGRVEASPLHMASVAAAAVTGTWHAPHLHDGERPEPQELPEGVADGLRTLLRAAVADGTGRAAELPGEPVLGKTGTAQFGTGPQLESHAWFVAVRGDLAVAVLVERGGGGGAVAAPVAARFLTLLDPQVEEAPEEEPTVEDLSAEG
jgi:cell division protein FtsI/penicillin-binding protein 2